MARQSNQATVAKLDHQRKKRFQLGLVAISAPKKSHGLPAKMTMVIHGLPEDLAPDTAIASMPHTKASGTMGRFRYESEKCH